MTTHPSWTGTRRGVGQADGLERECAALDSVTRRFLADIQVEMPGGGLACLELRGEVGMEI